MKNLIFSILFLTSISFGQMNQYSFVPKAVPESTEFNITLSSTNFKCNTNLGGIANWMHSDSIFISYIIINKNYVEECFDSSQSAQAVYSFYGLNKGIYKLFVIQGTQCWGIFCNPVKDTTKIGHLFVQPNHKNIANNKCGKFIWKKMKEYHSANGRLLNLKR